MNISVFEHEVLKVGEKGFTKNHWEKLVKLNEKARYQYMDIGYHYIRFKQYVGVLQVGGIQLEILPKVDRITKEGEKSIWQNVLVDMLVMCKKMPAIHLSEAHLRFREMNILEIYVHYFLQLLEELVQKGIIKKYEYEEGNSRTLKGKLMFSKHIQHNNFNLSHFYTRHQVFNTNHLFHQIIVQSLQNIQQQFSGSLMNKRIQKLLHYFPIQNQLIPPDFNKIHFNFTKENQHYEKVMQFCKMFLLHESPQFSTGSQFMLSLLFDMNQLWEEYIYRQLKSLENNHLKVYTKQRVNFWGESSYVEPDIIVEQEGGRRIIIDTKWKVLNNLTPNHKDLQQMFVYNYLHNAEKAILLYPKAYFENGKKDYFYQYDQEEGNVVNEANQCEIAFVDVCQNREKIREQLAKLIV